MRTRHAAVAAFLVLAALATLRAQPPGGSRAARPEDPTQLTADNARTVQSYRVVPVALQWLAKRQDKDGSWSFANSGRTGEPTWANPGTWQSKQGATGLVLLCYLSAGQTHKTRGPYRENIAAAAKMR